MRAPAQLVGIMPITITADAVTEIPEPLRTTAKEENGKFVLQAPEGWGVENVAAVRGKQTKLEQDLARRDARLKAYAKDEAGTLYEPDEIKESLAELARLREAQGKAPQLEDLRKQAVAEAQGLYTRKLTEAEKRAADFEKRAAELDRELDNSTLENAISSAIAEMRPKEGKAEIARLLLKERARIDKEEGRRAVRVNDPAGNGFMTGSGPDGFLGIREFGLNMLRTQHPDLFQGDGASGAGAGAGPGRRTSGYTFKRADLQNNAGAFLALQRRAKAEGKPVEIID